MLHITLRQLKVFESVARNLSFSRAAEELYLTQPAVSMQIKQLEDNIDLPLFEQMGKRIYLTDAGRELYHYSKAISQQLADMELALDELKGLERGKLNISVVSTANYFAPHLLAKFCQRYSGVTVSLNVSNRETVLKHLADNLTDLAIMGQPPDDLDIASESFMENPLVVIAPPDHPLCKMRQIPVKRLEQETFLVRERARALAARWSVFFRPIIFPSIRAWKRIPTKPSSRRCRREWGWQSCHCIPQSWSWRPNGSRSWMCRIFPSCAIGMWCTGKTSGFPAWRRHSRSSC